MKLQKYISKLLDVLIAFVLLLFFSSFGFRDSRTSGWYQQFLPNLNGKQITDITFLDSLTGYAVATQQFDTSYILKTTNSGDNWIIIYRSFLLMQKLQFLNLNTGYACGAYLFKTINGGLNWNQVNAPPISPENMYVLNEDTVWIISHESLTGGVFRTTNRGLNWDTQFTGGTENPNNIYMYNSRIGFIINNNTGLPNLRKTTDGGSSWSIVAPNERFYVMYFTDSLTGWKSNGEIDSSMKKTTNGGLNWIKQNLPNGGYIASAGMTRFSNVNKDTIWGVGNFIVYPNNQVRPMLYRTTNGGNNWHYQVPDTSIVHLQGQYTYIKFVNKYLGWAYHNVNQGIHTLTGGDSLFILSVHQNITETPNDYVLFQNYPNPFNAMTNFKWQISNSGFITLKIFNLLGKEVATLINEKKLAGNYIVSFDATELPSGIYFYTLYVNGIIIDTKKAILIK